MQTTKQALCRLSEEVAAVISPYRMAHTRGVFEMAARLADLFCPRKRELLMAAALLHDITKEREQDWHLACLAQHGYILREDEVATPKIWHAITAPYAIEAEFPQWADPALLSAVRWHTTGREGMTLTEALLYLADFIEEGRQFSDCVTLRSRFFDPKPEAMTAQARLSHLREVLLLSFDMTVGELQAAGQGVCLDTLAARRDLQTKNDFLERN